MPIKSNRPKLVKTRSSDNSLLQSQLDDYSELNCSRTSVSDLRSAQRPAFLRQPSGTFEEDVGTAADMTPFNKRLTRTASASALDQEFGASPTSVNSIDFIRTMSGSSLESSRSPPPVPDLLKSTKLDLEQAINLLQELKKTASPEELVSLHRALLPTRDASPGAVPQLSSIGEHVAYSTSAAPRDRVRSAIPPGLATRSGMSGDPLRSQEDVAKMTEASKEKKGAWFSDTRALASVRTRARTLSMISTGTAPDTTTVHNGAFGPGTLRITNGSASPEPGIITKLVAEKEGEVARIQDVTDEDDAEVVKKDTPVQQPNLTPSRRLSLDVQFGQGSLDSARTNPPATLAERRQKQWGMRITTAPVGTTSIPMPQSSSAKVKPDDRVELRSQRHTKRRTVGHSADLSITTDLPRFGQRWAHRAAHLSNEYMLDCDITSSPYDEELDPTKRLSTVHDIDEEKRDSGTDACVQALLKLTGRSDITTDGSDADEVPSGTAISSDESKSSGVSHLDPRFRVPYKQDSGYCSEASNCSSPPQLGVFNSSFLGKELEPTPEQPAELESLAPSRAATIKAEMPRTKDAVDSDVAGLINMHEQLSATSSLTATPSPRPEIIKLNEPPQKKSFSPLALFKSRNRASKRASLAPAEVKSTEKSDRDRVIATATAMQTPSGDYAASRQSMDGKRRLQKRMPEAVREVRMRQSMDIASQARSMESPASSPPVPTLHLGSSTNTKSGKTVFHSVPPSVSASDADDESKSTASTATERTSSSWRRRSKSFARKRSHSTLQEPKAEESPAPSLPATPQPSTPERRRNRSIASFGLSSKRQSVDTAGVSCTRSAGSTESTHKDFSSVARALDPASHEEAKESRLSAALPKAISKVKSSKNLRARATINLAESKAKDSNTMPDKKTRADIAPVLPMPHISSYQRTVEDLFPEWQGKPASKDSSPAAAAMEAQLLQAFPYAGASKNASSCIPPLPELPADMDLRVSRAEEMVAKKLRLSPKPSPSPLARTSVDSAQARKQAVVKQIPKPKPEAPKLAVESKPRADDEDLFEAESIKDEPAGNSEGAHPRFSFEEIPKPGIYLPYRPANTDAPRSSSPTQDAKYSGWPGWETQSKLWQQKTTAMESTTTLTSVGTARPFEEKIPVVSESETGNESDAPAIVVSRYITPLTSESASRAKSRDRKNSAPSAIQSTSDLLEDTKDAKSVDANLMRTNSMVSTATFVTMWSSDERPSKVDVGRSSSAFSSTTTTTTVSTVSSRTSYATSNSSSTSLSQNAQGTNRGSSQAGNYLPYRPTDSVVAERSRALNKARRSCNIRTEELAHLGLVEEEPPLPSRSTDVPDRFSGGLGYGWDRETGFIASAGSRNGSTETVNRKSVKTSETYGLDLTDIPIFLQRRPN
ncbi:uncharacterized protein MYCFIDRAFT_216109 [Pseudocercospora fijiensis CIRAD86]|uniref:Uncharacterized protein n=1 Tax=Pseudocercospora fijiensis (strain CIRAD86) TaxID=383855 RepID=M3ARQ4_PSEFD|nr:uncharacterized protein MYCFIDRAFT_216109 [Pseudocercospora fijiensis CIRAD86]EME80127.1 hypothetical protein MYCFIDRAFT_216109 [Pseudocercospora fijiensis CIRAD86]